MHMYVYNRTDCLNRVPALNYFINLYHYSLRKVLIDPYHGNCLYNPSLIRNKSPSPELLEDLTTYRGPLRKQRLLIVRDLFVTSYKKALSAPEEGIGSRLASVFLGRRNT